MEKTCPLLNDICIEHKCRFWIHVQGMNPQSGATVDHWDCAIAWLPILLIENANEQRKTSASVHSFRNEMARQQGMLILKATSHPEIEAKPSGDAT